MLFSLSFFFRFFFFRYVCLSASNLCILPSTCHPILSFPILLPLSLLHPLIFCSFSSSDTRWVFGQITKDVGPPLFRLNWKPDPQITASPTEQTHRTGLNTFLGLIEHLVYFAIVLVKWFLLLLFLFKLVLFKLIRTVKLN